MTRNGLPERELRGLLEILGEVHHAEDLASFRQGLLDVLPRVVPSVYTSYNEITPDGQPLVAIVSPEPEQQWLELWGRLGHQNPLIQRYLSTRDPRAYRMSDVIDAPTFRRLDLYREVFAPLGVHHQMAVTCPPRRGCSSALLSSRPTTTPTPSAGNARPRPTAPHPGTRQRRRARATARRPACDRERPRRRRPGDRRHDDRERIAFASQAGRDALQLLDGASRRDSAPLPDALQAATANHVVMPVHDDAPLIVRRLPSERGTTVFLFERSERPTPLAQIEALGLSPREAEVLRRFMRGESTAEAAQSLAISPRTIHKHAEGIYRKLGVTDRVAAVSTAWSALDAGR